MMLYTGRRMTGTEAHEIGLADQLVEEGNEREAALKLATEIAANAPIAVQDMRRTLRAGLAEDVRAALKHELAQQRIHMTTADFREGIRAVSKRESPAFIGT